MNGNKEDFQNELRRRTDHMEGAEICNILVHGCQVWQLAHPESETEQDVRGQIIRKILKNGELSKEEFIELWTLADGDTNFIESIIADL